MKRALTLALALPLALAALGGCASSSEQPWRETTAGRATCGGVRVACRVAERVVCGGDTSGGFQLDGAR